MPFFNIKIDDQRILLATIYGPNKDDPFFCVYLQNNIIKMGNNNVIITGDFNILIEPPLTEKKL